MASTSPYATPVFDRFCVVVAQARHAEIERVGNAEGLLLILHCREMSAIKRDAAGEALFEMCARADGRAFLMGVELIERTGQSPGLATLMRGKTALRVIRLAEALAA